jgi:hypothetical protein
MPAGCPKLVVGDHIGALLRVGPTPRNHHRDLGNAELPRCEDVRVSRNYPAFFVGEHRVRPAPLLHACRNLRDLSFGMSSGISRIRDQPVNRPALDLIRRPDGLARGRA